MHSSTAVLAVQCPLQTGPVTEPRVHYIHTRYHISPLTHQSLTITFTITLTLLTILISLQPLYTGVVMCLGQGADLHMAQLMPVPLTISCSSKSRLVFLPDFTFLVPARPARIQDGCKMVVCVCVCACACVCLTSLIGVKFGMTCHQYYRQFF